MSNLKGGMTIGNKDAMELMKEDGCVVMDVRTPMEYKYGHIKGAVNFYLGEFETRFTKEYPNKDQLILIHCTMGNMSRVATQILTQMGYTRVFDIGGIYQWSGEIEQSM